MSQSGSEVAEVHLISCQVFLFYLLVGLVRVIFSSLFIPVALLIKVPRDRLFFLLFESVESQSDRHIFRVEQVGKGERVFAVDCEIEENNSLDVGSALVHHIAFGVLDDHRDALLAYTLESRKLP